MEVEYVGDAFGVDVRSNRLVALLGGAPTVPDAAGFVYATNGDDGHPHGNASRCRTECMACVQFHAKHDADGSRPRFGSNTAADRVSARADPRVTARSVP